MVPRTSLKSCRERPIFKKGLKSDLFPGAANGGEDGEDPVVEVPPPMQPISSLPVAAAASSTSVDQKVRIPGSNPLPKARIDLL